MNVEKVSGVNVPEKSHLSFFFDTLHEVSVKYLLYCETCALRAIRIHIEKKFYIKLPFNEIFGSFAFSTKEPYTIRLCLSLALSLSSSVHTSLGHMVRHRNFIFGINLHMWPPFMHTKYLLILT